MIKRDTTMLVPNEKSFVSRRKTSRPLCFSYHARVNEIGRERELSFLTRDERKNRNVNLLYLSISDINIKSWIKVDECAISMLYKLI